MKGLCNLSGSGNEPRLSFSGIGTGKGTWGETPKQDYYVIVSLNTIYAYWSTSGLTTLHQNNVGSGSGGAGTCTCIYKAKKGTPWSVSSNYGGTVVSKMIIGGDS